MNSSKTNKGSNLSFVNTKLKENVDKNTFFKLILEAIDEFKKGEYKRGEVRNYFYNAVFETVFSIEEDNTYVPEYIEYFKNNVPFDLNHFEAEIKNMKKVTRCKRPYLLGKNGSERVDISKSVYRIGNDNSEADYVIGSSSAISKRHADIIVKKEHYFICGKSSVNKTYIDGKEIQAEETIEIYDGTRLKFTNKEFVFYV